MRSLPIAAKVFIVFVCLLGAISVALAAIIRFPYSPNRSWEIPVYLLLAILAGGKKVTLSKKVLNEEVGSMSLGFAITFTALLQFGPAYAVLIGAASNLSSCLFPKRQALHQVAFNVALGAFEALAGGLVFIWLNGWTLELNSAQAFLSVASSAVMSFSVNTTGVAAIIALCSGTNGFKIWRENFLWTAPSYFATAGVGALAILLFHGQVSATLLFIAPVIYLVYQTYVTKVSLAEEKVDHMRQMQLSQQHLAELYLATIKSLALAIDAKDQYTHQHIVRVQRYAVAIAREMGLTGSELEAVNTGALLHDIGKLGVPEYVLVKPGKLTPEEFEKIKKHPEIGASILEPVEFPWPVLPVVRHHHERWDGLGYPDGLKGEEIPLTARIMAVADVYDALTSTRSYRRAWTHEKAIETIENDSGSHFDPQVVEAFLRVVDQVVREMAAEGEGPLAGEAQSQPQVGPTDQGVTDISHASEEIWALYEVAQSLSSSIGTTDAIDILSRKLAAVFPGAGCALLMAEDGGLRVRAANGPNSSYFFGGCTANEKSLSAKVVKSQTSFRGEFSIDDILLTQGANEPWVELSSCLIVPIMSEGSALGTMNLYDARPSSFSAYDQVLLELLADQAAPAIFNALLFDRSHTNEPIDPITGLPGMGQLNRELQEWCDKGNEFTVLCLDLDSFKSVNEAFGHEEGDRLLAELAGLLRHCSGPNALVARQGADEFAICVPADKAVKLAEKMSAAIGEFKTGLIVPEFGEVKLAASIGMASYPSDGTSATLIISSANAEMRTQKTRRRLQAMSRVPKAA